MRSAAYLPTHLPASLVYVVLRCVLLRPNYLRVYLRSCSAFRGFSLVLSARGHVSVEKGALFTDHEMSLHRLRACVRSFAYLLVKFCLDCTLGIFRSFRLRGD